jgi:hypothetical protein
MMFQQLLRKRLFGEAFWLGVRSDWEKVSVVAVAFADVPSIPTAAYNRFPNRFTIRILCARILRWSTCMLNLW